MTWRQLKKVHNGYIELYAKWAGSEKIPGCCKRNFPTVNITDKTTENNRAANEYLNVSFNKNNNWIDIDFHQEWDYWNFDFSPCKIDRERKLSQEEIFKDYWQGRWKYLVEIAKQPKPEGKDQRKVETILNNYRQSYFHYRNITCKDHKRSNDSKKQSISIAQGIIVKHQITTRIISKLSLWIRKYRMDKEKRRKLNDFEELYMHEEGSEMEVVNQEHEADLDTIDLLQDDKYWITIGSLTNKLSQYRTKYITDQKIKEVMEINEEAEVIKIATVLKSNREESARKKDVTVATLESFLQESFAAGTQEMKETYDVIGHGVRITYELVNLRVIKEIEKDLQGCKGMVDESIHITADHKEEVRNALECRTCNLNKIAEQYNKMRTSLLTGVAYDRAICQMDIVSEAQGAEMLDARMAAGMSPPATLESSSLRNDL